jgi:hypothetical protein
VQAGFLLSGNRVRQPALLAQGSRPKIRQGFRGCTRGFCNVLYPPALGAQSAIAAGCNGSIGSTVIPQNAGCTMAIHADCTTTEMYEFYKLLIYNDF